jgi:hypothetical protein
MNRFNDLADLAMSILVVAIISIFAFVETIHWLIRWVL